MASSAKNLFKVNLLIHKGDQVKLYTRAFKWLLSSGRFIVVLVELVVVGAFIYRYQLDAQLESVQEKIKSEVPYVQSLKNDDAAIRRIQFQLSAVKQLKSSDPGWVEVLLKMAQLTPKSIKLTNITFTKVQAGPKVTMSITGLAPSGSNLQVSAFLKALQKDPMFSDVTLGNISFEEQTTFTITGSLNSSGIKS